MVASSSPLPLGSLRLHGSALPEPWLGSLSKLNYLSRLSSLSQGSALSLKAQLSPSRLSSLSQGSALSLKAQLPTSRLSSISKLSSLSTNRPRRADSHSHSCLLVAL